MPASHGGAGRRLQHTILIRQSETDISVMSPGYTDTADHPVAFPTLTDHVASTCANSPTRESVKFPTFATIHCPRLETSAKRITQQYSWIRLFVRTAQTLRDKHCAILE